MRGRINYEESPASGFSCHPPADFHSDWLRRRPAATHGSAPIIAVAPANASTPLGQSGTFTVTAQGVAPFTYQWSKDGVAISGSNQSSYTTPAVVLADSGSTFAVTVSNTFGSVTSAPATLTVGPRSPQAGDLRFQLVASSYSGTPPACGDCIATDLFPGLGYSFPNAVGTPLQVGLDYGEFMLMEYMAPSQTPSLTTSYQSDVMANLDQDIAVINSGGGVISGLTLQPTTIGGFGMRWFSTSQSSGFQYGTQTVAASALDAYATLQAAQSRIITAVSYDASGNVVVISYGLQGESTVYETKTSFVTFDTVTAEAQALAAEGYIITAFGGGHDDLQGNPINGMLLVGTRVQGDSIPRSPQVVDPVDNWALVNQGYLDVGRFINPSVTNSNGLYIAQK